MNVEKFVETLDAEFYTGVPDSQLSALCNYLHKRYNGDSSHHIIGANEGNCVAMAAGYHLSTGKIPVVYMQNSGQGNAINPIASLLNEKVYAIPSIFVIGWRGEPGVKDEPQHIFQGEITLKLLELLEIPYFILSKDTHLEEVASNMLKFKDVLKQGKSVAFVVRKGALTFDEKIEYANEYTMQREEIIDKITDISGDNPIICTTGKASRELFEIREAKNQKHGLDFLTVGSMGHSSSIALSVAINKPDKKIWCIDGDGAMIMHTGAMATIGSVSPENFIHILINNEAHETVGGMPTVSSSIDYIGLAKACGYKQVFSVDNMKDLNNILINANKNSSLSFIEVKTAIGSREDLGRPTTTSIENKKEFMDNL